MWGRVRSDDWENADYTPCSYYDDVAKKNGCKYHAAAGDICRGKHLGVNTMADMCHLQNSRQLNCIRRCLIRKDAQARQDPNCKKEGTCSTGTCTKLSCINRYHEECFVECGSKASCYGGNYWQGFTNDGD
jgi:hypothetical protein